MKKIILAGASLNSGNKGVNALTRGQIMLILDKYGIDTEIIILSYTVSDKVINEVKYRNKTKSIIEIPCGKKSLLEGYIKSNMGFENYIIKEIKSANEIWDISEGDSFSDIYGIKRFTQHSLIKLITIKLNKKLIIMPQTLGPFNRRIVKSVATRILNKSNYVFVRDELSKKIAKEELGIKRSIKFIPDMAFYMQPDNELSIDRFIENKNNIKVGINVSALLYNGGYNGKNMFNLKVNYKELVDKLIEKFATMDSTEVILIPHVMTKEFEVEDDFRVCKKIAQELSEKLNIKVKTIDKYYREDELKAIISGCDFFVGSRMHACIGAISTHVPTAPIAYSRKFIGIWDKIGLAECVTDPREHSEAKILESILKSFEQRKSIKEKLDLEIPLLKNKIEKIADIIEEK